MQKETADSLLNQDEEYLQALERTGKRLCAAIATLGLIVIATIALLMF